MENQTLNAPMTLEQSFNASLEMFKDGGSILMANQALASKIIAAGQSILNKLQESGGEMTPEFDQLCNDYLAKVNLRLKEMNDARKPVTQMLTAVQKLFTAEEAKIDVKVPNTIPFIIQDLRNIYAKNVAAELKRKQEEADRKAKKAQEIINVKSMYETGLSNYFNDYLLKQKQILSRRFNEITLEQFDEVAEKLKAYTPAFSAIILNDFSPALITVYNTKDEITSIVDEIKASKYEPFELTYKQQLSELRDQLLMRLPSKYKELQALAEADKEEAERIAAEKQRREEEEARRLEEEAQKAKQSATSVIESNAMAEEAMTLFNREADMAVDAPMPEARTGYEIILTHKSAYVQLFQLWWEHEGKSQTDEKIEKKTIGSMKKFCEKLAHDKNIKIDSKFISYEPTYKAVNRQNKD